jgi:tetratricopeptide (TPR) repeat protein
MDALYALKARHPGARPTSTGAKRVSKLPSIRIIDGIFSRPLFEWEAGQFTSKQDTRIADDLTDQHMAAVSWFHNQNFPIPLLEDELQADYLYEMGLQAQQAGVIKEAWGGLHVALDHYLRLENRSKIADCFYSLGRVYGVKNDLRLANALFQQAVYLTHTLGIASKEAWALTYLGMSSGDLGLTPLAREAYDEAKRIFKNTDPSQAEKVAKLINALPAEPASKVQPLPASVDDQKLKEAAHETHWAAGASTWEQLAKAFIHSQIQQPNPDFQGLNERLQPLPPAERHGAWIRVAQEFWKNHPDLAVGCYVEALANDPDPNSVAWGWLSGQYNPKLKVLEASQPHSVNTVEKLKKRYGII